MSRRSVVATITFAFAWLAIVPAAQASSTGGVLGNYLYVDENAAGSDNVVSVSQVVGPLIRITDSSGITPVYTGCVADGGSAVKCTVPTSQIIIDVGDGTNQVTKIGVSGGSVNAPPSTPVVFYGGDNGDTFSSGYGPDTFNGGSGVDTVSYSQREATTGEINANLSGGTGDDGGALDGPPGTQDTIGADVENITGGADVDKLTGGSGVNVLNGGDGNDQLIGGLGNDQLIGGNGAQDFASYSDRTGIVTATLGASGNGEAGESDTIAADIEGLGGGSGNDSLTGTAAADFLAGEGGGDTLHGLAGDDQLHGNGGGDSIFGGGDNDAIYGDDSYFAGFGNDILNGGTGDDTFAEGVDRNGGDTFTGGIGTDAVDYQFRTENLAVTIGAGADDGGGCQNLGDCEGDDVQSDVENVTGGSGDDALTGNALANVLTGNSGNDFFTGGVGTDSYFGVTGTDTVSYADHSASQAILAEIGQASGNGNTGVGGVDGTFGENLTNQIDNLIGTPGDDQLLGDGNDNSLTGGLGGDALTGGGGNDFFHAGAGPDGTDTVIGGTGTQDHIYYGGRNSNVQVTLGDGLANDGDGAATENDNIASDVEWATGGAVNDFLTGANAVINRLDGDDGNDTLDGGDGAVADELVGGAGLGDTVTYGGRTAGVTADLTGDADDGETTEGDRIDTTVEYLVGGSGADELIGSAGNNNLTGGDGVDTLRGMGGLDNIYAQDGNSDTIDCSGGGNPGGAFDFTPAENYINSCPNGDGDGVPDMADLCGQGGAGSNGCPLIGATRISRPPSTTRSSRTRVSVRIRFSRIGSQPGTTFRCRYEGRGIYRSCASSFRKTFRRGRHKVQARTRDAYGNLGPVATKRFRIVKR